MSKTTLEIDLGNLGTRDVEVEYDFFAGENASSVEPAVSEDWDITSVKFMGLEILQFCSPECIEGMIEDLENGR